MAGVKGLELSHVEKTFFSPTRGKKRTPASWNAQTRQVYCVATRSWPFHQSGAKVAYHLEWPCDRNVSRLIAVMNPAAPLIET